MDEAVPSVPATDFSLCEGMAVKPLEFVARGSRGLIQPALK